MSVEKICGIYCITNTSNNKIYIGQSIDIEKRFAGHQRDLSKNKHFNPHLQRSYNLGHKFDYNMPGRPCVGLYYSSLLIL